MSPKLLSIQELGLIAPCTRETVGKKLVGVEFKEGPKGAKLYEARVALPILWGLSTDVGEEMDQAEANRQLTIARKEQIELEMEVTRGIRPKLSEVLDATQAIFDDIAGIIKGSDLPEDRKSDIMQRLAEGTKEVAAL